MTKEALNFHKSLREKQGKGDGKIVGGQWDLSHPARDGAALGTGGLSWKGASRGCWGAGFIPGSSLGSSQPWGTTESFPVS